MLGVLSATLLAACGDDGTAGAPPTSTPSTSTPSTATVPPPSTSPSAPTPADGGWIGDEPQWHGGEGGDAASVGDGDTAEMVAEDAAATGAPRTTPDTGDSAEPATSPQEGTALRAGNVDDNTDFDAYLAYLARIADLGVPMRTFDATGRVVVTVTGADGRPAAGEAVTVTSGGAEVARLVTTADGTARFLPALYGQPTDATFVFAAGDATVDAAAGTEVALAVGRDGGATAPVPLDVLFLLDATGSMGDEIDRLKTSIDSVAERVAALEGAPDVRFAMTLYRDLGDTFVTATHDFTSDVAAFRAALADVVAEGGGDYPEALDEGIAEALAAPTWRDPATAVQLVFLVADAPPQVTRQVDTPYPASVAEAVGRGVKVFPIASSESDDQAEAVFRQIAQATGARFVFLSYGAAGAATGGSTEELALDDLVVRLVAEELAALTGDSAVVPPPTPTTSTVPDGQGNG